MDRRTWQATVHRVAEGQTQLSTHSACTFILVVKVQGPTTCPLPYWVRLGFENVLEKAMAPHSSTLAWKIPWMEEPGRLQSMGSQSRRRLSDFTFTFHFHALEKEMAPHSSVLAWRIPGTGESGGQSSLGSHRVGHDEAT